MGTTAASTFLGGSEPVYQPPTPSKEFPSRESFAEFKDSGPLLSPQYLKYAQGVQAANGIEPVPWQLVPDATGDGAYTVYVPRIIRSYADVTLTTTITITPFVPTIGEWVVIVIDGTFAPTLSMVSTWDSYPSAFKFDGDDYESSTLPLYQFVAADTAGAFRLTDSVWAISYVHAYRASWATEQITGSNHLRDVLLLL